jgi:hypothetical protein
MPVLFVHGQLVPRAGLLDPNAGHVQCVALRETGLNGKCGAPELVRKMMFAIPLSRID